MTNEQLERLLRASCDFQANSIAAREVCREQFRRGEGDGSGLLRILIDGQVAVLAAKIGQRVVDTTPATSYQIGLCASFIRTHYLVSDCILNGDLVEAITLTRKQLESVARLHELDTKPLQRLSGRVPNIRNVLKGGAGRMYGDLSEVAHFSTPRVTLLLRIAQRGELVGPSLVPMFTPNAAACFEMAHFIAVYFLGWLVEKLPTWYPEYDNTGDRELLGTTVTIALDAGVLRMPEDEPSEDGPEVDSAS